MSKCYRNLSEDEKMLTLEEKICQTQIEKEKKYMKHNYYKRKDLWNRLISCVKELENVSFL